MKNKILLFIYCICIIAFAVFIYLSKPYFFNHVRKQKAIKSNIELYRIEHDISGAAKGRNLDTIVVEEVKENQFVVPNVPESVKTLDGVIADIVNGSQKISSNFEQFVGVTKSFSNRGDAEAMARKIQKIDIVIDLHLSILVTESKGLYFVEVASFPSAEDAATMCNQLKSYEVSCIPVRK